MIGSHLLAGRHVQFLWPFLVSNRLLVAGALLAGVLKFTTPLIVISLTAGVIDTVTNSTVSGPQSTRDVLIATGWVIALVLCVGMPAAFFRQYLSDTLAVRAALDLRRQVFERLLNMPFYKRRMHRVGDLGARLLSDVQQTAMLVGDGLIYFWIDVVSVIVVSGFILHQDLIVGGLCLLILPIYYWSLGYWRQRIRLLSSDAQHDLGLLTAHVQERVQATQMIQDHGAVRFESRRFRPFLDQVRRSNLRRSRMKSFSVMASHLLTQVPAFVVLGVGGVAVLQGDLTVGAFAAIALYVRQIFWPLDNLANFNVKLATALGSMDRLADLLETPEKDTLAAENTVRQGIGPRVTSLSLTHVSARYDVSETAVLKDVSCNAAPGDWIAIVGASGMGKTTLTRILMRWMPPTSGAILVNDMHLTQFPLDDWRNAVSYVSQDNTLLSGSLIDNITYASLTPDLDRVWRVCEAVRIADFIRTLPQGLDQQIAEFGSTLSAGQAQRLCLARALYREPQVLILDEVTANLDESTERKVYRAVKELMQHGIVLSVAHRPAVMAFATHVLRLEKSGHTFHPTGNTRSQTPEGPDDHTKSISSCAVGN